MDIKKKMTEAFDQIVLRVMAMNEAISREFAEDCVVSALTWPSVVDVILDEIDSFLEEDDE